MPLQSGNSTALINAGTQDGMYNWSVNGENQLFQQWFWYRVGAGGPESAINTISAAAIVPTGLNEATITYANAQLSIRVDYTLSGSAPGTGHAQMGESITINNLSSGPLDFHFFQYSDFDLNGDPGGDTVQVFKNLNGKYYEADQSRGVNSFSETTATGGDPGQPPGADRAEANFYPGTLNSLNDGGPTTLNNIQGPLGTGDVTWAFEWDTTLAQGGSMVISKLKTLDVPEPGTLALAGLGLTILLTLRRRK